MQKNIPDMSILDLESQTDKEQAKYLLAIARNIPDAICSIDLSCTVRSWNKGAEAMFGYAADEIIGKSLAVIIPEELAQKEIEYCINTLNTEGVLLEYETPRVTKDGRTLPVELTAVVLKDEGQNITGYAAIMRDSTRRKRAEEALRITEASYRTIFDAASDAIFIQDPETGDIIDVNQAMVEMYGYTRDEALHMSVEDLSAGKPGFTQKEALQIIRRAAEGEPQLFEWLAKDKSGRLFWVEVSLKRVMLRGRDHLLAMVRDITERKQAEEVLRRAYDELEMRVQERTRDLARLTGELRTEIEERRRTEEALRRSEKRLSSITSNVAEGIYVLNENGRIIFMNPEAERLLGWSIDELNEKGPHNLIHFCRIDGTALPFEECSMHRVIKTGKRFSSTDEVFVRKDGSVFPISVISAPIIEDDRVIASVTAFHDITELKKAAEEIKHMAHHDVLTGLPNRRFFMDIITIELAQARRNQKKAAILFLDLDRFKEVNDTFGHEAGDEVLKAVAGRLKSNLRESDTVARIGGDEFNILLADIAYVEDITIIVRKIMDPFRTPCLIAGHELRVTASIGISIYPDDSEEIDALFKLADMALYHAKELAGNTYQFYNPDVNIRSAEKMRFEGYLRQTIERGELEVYYQPQIDIKTGRIVCAEALVRWMHPEVGMLPSQRFIPAAEETGFITSIDEWVLRTACTQLKVWHEAGFPPVCVTVNLSAREFQNPGLVTAIARILDETGLSPDLLDIEITESMIMRDIEHTIKQLNELTAMGVRISIDDFGTGYSSLSYLKRLPIQRLKIDGSFVKDIPTDPDGRAIIQAVTAMAHKMKMTVAAEGVETEEQLLFLRETRCDEAQGYLFNKPLPPERFTEVMAAGK